MAKDKSTFACGSTLFHTMYTCCDYIYFRSKNSLCLQMDINKTSKEIIGEMLKKKREDKKITQSQLAYLLSVDRQYVWRLENGRVNLTMNYLDKLISILECTPADFLVIHL